MDLAKTLVRSVVRAFYETRHVLIIDALVIHSALRDDDLAYLISMNIKDLHKMCQRLKEDRLLASHSRSELREGQQRPNNRTYYYIDYRQTIDAIKWRVYKIDKDLQGPVVPPSEKKEYFCDHCKAEWTQMEVLDSVGPQGFLCHRCGTVLRHGDSSQSGGHERSTRMNNQFKFITDLLPKIDSVVIPDNDFEVAFNNKRPVMRDATHQTATSIGVDAMNRPTAVKGLANTGPSTLSVSIQAGNGPSEEEKAAERALRERVAQQNALPSWMSNSTVTGEAFKTDLTHGVPSIEDDVKNPLVKGSTDANAEAAIDDYFARLKKQAAEEAQKKMAGGSGNGDDDEGEDGEDGDEEDEEEEEEDEFEDVVQTTANNSGNATPASTGGGGLAPPVPTAPPPASSTPPQNGSNSGVSSSNHNHNHNNSYNHSTVPKAPSPLRQSHTQSTLKREATSDPPSPSGGGDRGAATTAIERAGSPSEVRLAKKIKIEDEASSPPAVPAETETPKPAVRAESAESDEDEDDIEFEDV
ncbi:transcription factor tfiie complex alpha [Niveomyces insectorum RCEF 264]|uniref:Transcription factor tfiie complex alpha n=1 Tax=Niveomyces insectorum RCEF 264 TaxID=1081102 RepID=A0A167X5U0_9HYPO|nr:transcription factor tfiie complex alpha [Niveomyces insectorum RCEF 264]